MDLTQYQAGMTAQLQQQYPNGVPAVEWKSFDPFAILGAGVFGGPMGALSAYSMFRNYDLQEKNYNYMKSMQEKAWAREDAATQRRVLDMIAAGLSPTLAAGNAATSSGPISLHAPQMDIGPIIQAAGAMAQLQQIEANTKQTKLENSFLSQTLDDRIAAKKATSAFDVASLNSRLSILQSQASLKEKEVYAQELENQIKRIKVDQEQVRLTTMIIEKDLAGKKVTALEKDILVKEQIIRQQNYNWDIYAGKLGLPIGSSINNVLQGILFADNAVRRALGLGY